MGRNQLNRPKVNQHQLSVDLASNNVGGFNVAVNHSLVMDKGNHRQQAQQQIQHVGLGHGATVNELLLE